MLLLLRRRNIVLLWIGGLVSNAGDWVLLIGLPIYVYRVTGSTLATGTTFLSGILPTLLLGSVAGVLVDRWDRRRTLIIVDLFFAAGLLPLLLVHSSAGIWIVYSVAFVESCLAQFASPAVSALVPRLTDEQHLPAVNSLLSVSNNVGRLGGPLLGGVLVQGVGLTGVALVDAASFLVAALSIALIRVPMTSTGEPSTLETVNSPVRWTGVWREWWAGLAVVHSSLRLSTTFTVMAITGIGEGVLATLYVPFVTRILHGTPVQYGWLNAGQAVGGLIGSIALAHVGSRIAPIRLVVLGYIGLGVVDLIMFDYSLIVPGIAPAFGLIVVAGIPSVIGFVSLITLLQTSVDDAYRGRIWGAFLTTEAGAKLVGTTVASVLGDRVGILPLLNIQGAGLVVAGLLVHAILSSRSAQ